MVVGGGWVVDQAITDPISGPSFVFCLLSIGPELDKRHLILANQKPVISATQKNSKVFQNGALKKRIFVLKISAFSAMIK